MNVWPLTLSWGKPWIRSLSAVFRNSNPWYCSDDDDDGDDDDDDDNDGDDDDSEVDEQPRWSRWWRLEVMMMLRLIIANQFWYSHIVFHLSDDGNDDDYDDLPR